MTSKFTNDNQAGLVCVLTISINNGDDIDETYVKLYKKEATAVEYVKNFIKEVTDDFDNCQVDSSTDFNYTSIFAGDFSEYSANLSIEKQEVI